MDHMEGCLENWQNTTSVYVCEMLTEVFASVGVSGLREQTQYG